MTPRSVAISIAWVAAACGSDAGDARVPTGPTITRVEVVGNEAVGDGEIIGGLATHGPKGILFKSYAHYDPVVVERDVERIESYYQRRGYFSAQVDDVDVRKSGGRVEVRFEVSEGEPTSVTEVDVTGLPAPLRDDPQIAELAAALGPEKTFDNQRYEETKVEIRQRLVARGYARADVAGVVEVHRDNRTASIQIEARPGPLVRLGETEIVGLDEVPEGAVRARLAWKAGDVFDPAKLEQTRSWLYALGFFRGIRIELEKGTGESAAGETTAGLRIHVSETAKREVRLGGGFAADTARYEARVRAGYIRRHFPDPLTTLRLEARPAYTIVRNATSTRGLGGEGLASLERHDLFVRRLRGEVRLSYRQLELEPYTSRGPGLRIGVDRPLYDGALRVGGGWEIRRLSFPRIDPAIDPVTAAEVGLVAPHRIGFFDQLVALDRRDNLLDARRGVYLELRLEEAGAWSGSEFEYIAATGDARGYLPLSDRLVVAGRVRAGETLSGELPITRAYFGGGASGHRGFGSRQLSPTVSRVDPETGELETTQIGGDALLESSAEIRYDVIELWGDWLGVVAFVDAGDVTESLADIGTPHIAPGLGLRYNTVIGPVRLDVAYRLNRTGPGEPEPGARWAYHISFGEAF